jgi:hypothetical protein
MEQRPVHEHNMMGHPIATMHKSSAQTSYDVILCSMCWGLSEVCINGTQPTPCGRVVLGKLVVTQRINNFSISYEIRSFITIFTGTLSWASWIQSIASCFVSLRLLTYFHLCLGFPSGFFMTVVRKLSFQFLAYIMMYLRINFIFVGHSQSNI